MVGYLEKPIWVPNKFYFHLGWAQFLNSIFDSNPMEMYIFLCWSRWIPQMIAPCNSINKFSEKDLSRGLFNEPRTSNRNFIVIYPSMIEEKRISKTVVYLWVCVTLSRECRLNAYRLHDKIENNSKRWKRPLTKRILLSLST